MLEVFRKGTVIDLAVPTLEFARAGIWHRWLNNEFITRYLSDQGVFPNTPDSQATYFSSLNESRILLVVQTKDGTPQGIVSLSEINWRRKHCDFALLLDPKVQPQKSPLAALEAAALITEHAIDSLGIQRIRAVQHWRLASWQQRLELIGYRIEGIHRNGFVKGSEIAAAMTVAAVADDIDAIRAKRGGKIFDSPDNMLNRIRSLPKKRLNESLGIYFSEVVEPYYRAVFDL